MSGPVEKAIRSHILPRQELYTPARKAPFRVSSIDSNGIVLLFGQKGTKTRITWACLEGVPGFLRGKDWVEIGTKFDLHSKPNTLDEYLKRHVYRATASWIAALLKKVEIAEIDDRQRPVRIRLKP